MRVGVKVCTWLVALSALAALPALSAEPLTPQQALAKLAESRALVKNYDVRWSLHATVPTKSEGPPPIDYQAREVAAEPQVFRTEHYIPTTDRLLMILASDGKIWTRWDVRNNRAFLGGPNPDVNHSCQYEAYFGNQELIGSGITLQQLLRERPNLRRVETADPDTYVLESEPTRDLPVKEPSPNMRADRSGYRLTLDPLNGYFPSRIEQYLDSMKHVQQRIEIKDYKPLPVGIAVPTKATITRFDLKLKSDKFGQVMEVREFEVDLSKSRWNCELDEGIGSVQLPAGTQVIDDAAPKKTTVPAVAPNAVPLAVPFQQQQP